MAQILKGPDRFTHPEWTQSNKTKYNNAEKERSAAERLVMESDRLKDETQKRVERTQADVDKKFEQRLDDIKYWKAELEGKLDGLVTEIDNLLAFKTRVEKALQACAEPLHIAQQCLANREKRRGIDLVHDDVQKELFKEVETIQGVMALLQRTIENCTEQVRMNRKAKYQLEKDLKDKFSAVSIDDYCATLRNNSGDIRYKEGAAKIESNSTTPEDWQDYSNENIKKGERERMNSVQLRTITDGVLQQTANDMSKQKSDVDLAFYKRIEETKDTKGKLENHLARVIAQIKHMEENISGLEKGINDKEQPMKLAQTRLDTRTNRPNVELCRDHVQYRLLSEVNEITTSIDQLNGRLKDSETSYKGLVRNQLELEEDIDIKANTLFIDEVQCMGMRESVSIQAF